MNDKNEIIQVNDKVFTIITCKDCGGKFWTKKSYLLHWSCNGKLRCSYCFSFGHTIANCDIRIEYDDTPMKDFIK